MTEQSDEVQLQVLENIYGRDRVRSQLEKFGSFAGFDTPDYAAMVDEALPALAHAMH